MVFIFSHSEEKNPTEVMEKHAPHILMQKLPFLILRLHKIICSLRKKDSKGNLKNWRNFSLTAISQ